MFGPMRRTSFATWPCPIAQAAELVGDAWTLLVLRELYYGETRFERFQSVLGVARNTLTDRLNTLVAAGMVERRKYQSDPVRYEYVLKDKGRDFFPVIASMKSWSDRYMYDAGDAPILLQHNACGHELQAQVVCQECGGPVNLENVRARPGPTFPAELLSTMGPDSRFGDL